MTNYLSASNEDGLVIAQRGRTVSLFFAPGSSVLERAAHSLARDLEKVTGCVTELTSRIDQADIVIAPHGCTPEVDRLVATGVIDSTGIRNSAGNPRWEGFTVQTVEDKLFIVGSDERGAAFGAYDFAEEIGVSPWHWLADVPVKQSEFISVTRNRPYSTWPSVQYRGIFLNDEEELDAWAKLNTNDPTLGPEAYEHIFDLLLRLKANYIWPAMHVNAFNHDPRNGQLAHEMGIVVGTSHCDILLRSNENEFPPWLQEHGLSTEYDFSVPGQNREELKEYWRGSIAQNKDYDVTWTVGMRGIHDSAFTTRIITENRALTSQEKSLAQVNLLGEVIATQRDLLEEGLAQPAHQIPQLFIPYKEVLDHYDAGLELPEDITMVWVDDNFGYVRRFPTELERQRAGGHGLYYHISYWSQPPRSYLASSSTSLHLMLDQLTESWNQGIQKLWVNNVGSLKPLELESEFFLRLAWDVGQPDRNFTVSNFLESFIASKFDTDVQETSAILQDYHLLNSQRKHELLASHAFSHGAYGDEATQRLLNWQDLFDRVNVLHDQLPKDQQDAFFELVSFKIHMAYFANAHFYHADRSVLLEAQGHGAAAHHHVEMVQAFYNARRNLTLFCNTKLADGKWAGLYTPELFPPPIMPMFPAATVPLGIAEHGLGAAVWGSLENPDQLCVDFWAYGQQVKWIDLFNQGLEPADFTITAPQWIQVSQSHGLVESEFRVFLSVADPHTPKTGMVTVSSSALATPLEIHVQVQPSTNSPGDFTGWLEADGYVCIPAAKGEVTSAGTVSSWTVTPKLARTGADVLQARVVAGQAPNPSVSLGSNALGTASFNFHLVTPGAHLLELHRLPLLDSTGSIGLGISVDGAEPFTVRSESTDSYRGDWTNIVLENVERLLVRLPYLEEGSHSITLHALDPQLALSDLIVYTTPNARRSLPPAYSTKKLADGSLIPMERLSASPSMLTTFESMSQRIMDVFGAPLGSAPVLPTIYTPTNFWDTATTFKRNVTLPLAQQPDQVSEPNSKVPMVKDRLAAVPHTPRVTPGSLTFTAASALHQSTHAWHTPALDACHITWHHTAAVREQSVDLAMHVPNPGLSWQDPLQAPGLHFRFTAPASGTYTVWLLFHFEHGADSSCVLSLDGTPQPVTDQFSNGQLYSFGTQHAWFWSSLSYLDLTEGEHVLSLYSTSSRLRVQEIQLILGDTLPSPRGLSSSS